MDYSIEATQKSFCSRGNWQAKWNRTGAPCEGFSQSRFKSLAQHLSAPFSQWRCNLPLDHRQWRETYCVQDQILRLLYLLQNHYGGLKPNTYPLSLVLPSGAIGNKFNSSPCDSPSQTKDNQSVLLSLKTPVCPSSPLFCFSPWETFLILP